MCDRIPISGLDVPASPLRRLQLKQNADVFVHVCVCVHVLLMLNVGYSAGPDTSCLINHFLSHQVTAGFLCSHVILALKMASNMFNFLFFFYFFSRALLCCHMWVHLWPHKCPLKFSLLTNFVFFTLKKMHSRLHKTNHYNGFKGAAWGNVLSGWGKTICIFIKIKQLALEKDLKHVETANPQNMLFHLSFSCITTQFYQAGMHKTSHLKTALSIFCIYYITAHTVGCVQGVKW